MTDFRLVADLVLETEQLKRLRDGKANRTPSAWMIYCSPSFLARGRNPVPNPVLSAGHSKRAEVGHFCLASKDLLVYAAGTLFCVEIKNYRGVISHASASDPGQIVQRKIGRYGEAIPAKLHQNPLRQAKGFVFNLKTYLATQVDSRFKNLFIVAVAAFVRNADTDIRPIWNWNSTEGIIYVDELPVWSRNSPEGHAQREL